MIRRRGRTAGGSCLGRPRVQETETETGQPAVRDALHLSDIADVHALWGGVVVEMCAPDPGMLISEG